MMNYNLVNCDTDSIMICKNNNKSFSKEEQDLFLQELNKQFPEKIKFEHDGIFTKVLVVKSKNYILLPEGKDKFKIKGSGFKDSKKEPILKEFMIKFVEYFMDEKPVEDLLKLYNEYCLKAFNIKDLKPWCKKVTLTDKIFRCAGHETMSDEEKKQKKIRSNESKIYDAIKHKIFQEGDKIYVFYKKDNTLCLLEDFDGIDYDVYKLIGKINSCLKTFNNIIDISLFMKYHLKTKRKFLDQLRENNNV